MNEASIQLCSWTDFQSFLGFFSDTLLGAWWQQWMTQESLCEPDPMTWCIPDIKAITISWPDPAFWWTPDCIWHLSNYVDSVRQGFISPLYNEEDICWHLVSDLIYKYLVQTCMTIKRQKRFNPGLIPISLAITAVFLVALKFQGFLSLELAELAKTHAYLWFSPNSPRFSSNCSLEQKHIWTYIA